MGTTIRDVAKLAGVSASTVSRVLNHKSVISPETSEKIRKAMRDLNYVPNDLARGLAKATSHVIGLAVDTRSPEDYSNRFFNRTVFALEAVAQEKGYNLMIVNADLREQKNRSILRLVSGKKLDGLIIPEKLANTHLLIELRKADFPFVILGKQDEPELATWVDIDNIQAGQIAAKHLLKKGYHQICFLTNAKNQLFEKERIYGFIGEMERKSISKDRYSVLEGGHEAQEIELFLRKINPTEQKTVACLCSNDRIAASVVHKARDLKISLPEAVGVLCFDNTDITEFLDPSISCIDVDTYEAGAQAADILLNQIKERDRKYRHILIPTRVIERHTTARKEA